MGGRGYACFSSDIGRPWCVILWLVYVCRMGSIGYLVICHLKQLSIIENKVLGFKCEIKTW